MKHYVHVIICGSECTPKFLCAIFFFICSFYMKIEEKFCVNFLIILQIIWFTWIRINFLERKDIIIKSLSKINNWNELIVINHKWRYFFNHRLTLKLDMNHEDQMNEKIRYLLQVSCKQFQMNKIFYLKHKWGLSE